MYEPLTVSKSFSYWLWSITRCNARVYHIKVVVIIFSLLKLEHIPPSRATIYLLNMIITFICTKYKVIDFTQIKLKYEQFHPLPNKFGADRFSIFPADKQTDTGGKKKNHIWR